MNILVLGAGVIGTSTAWYLRQAGHEVTVLDRQPAAALETSFANGGQISVSHAEPWANPHVLPDILRWLGKADAPLRLHRRLDTDFLRWGLAFLRECWPQRSHRNIRAIVHLALFSRGCLQTLREQLSLNYDQRCQGILHLFTTQRALRRAHAAASLMNRLGLDRHPVTVDTCLALEPALSAARHRLVGGDYTASDESGDAHRFTQQLASHAAAAGVSFRWNTRILALTRSAGRVCGVSLSRAEGQEEVLSADAVVLCLGSESPHLVAPLGIHLPIYPAKGYSATLDIPDTCLAPTISLTDDERKLVFSRLGQRLRIAGTAEFNGFNRDLDPLRCQALLVRARELFPQLPVPTETEAHFWCGLRPSTPSNVPLIGGSGFPGLWLNTGHGTLGWTLACGSGVALTDMINGQTPAPDFPFRAYTA